MFQNRLTELLGCEYPIIEGGMVYVGNGRLAAAVSQAGCFGQIGAGGMSDERLRAEIREAKSLTDKPFGVNVPLGMSGNSEAQFRIILEEGVKVVTLAAGNPAPLIKPLKEQGLIIMVVVGAVRHALKAQSIGADIIVAEGFEAGGHNSPTELTTFAMIPQVSSAVEVPVVAAGGVMNGRGLVAALALGAAGVQIGTRFVATQESPAHENYKQALINATDESTVVVERKFGLVTRVIKGSYAAQILEVEKNASSIEELLPYISGEKCRITSLDGILDEGYAYSGQGAGLIKSIPTVKELIDGMIAEAERVRASLPLFKR
ncbi:MAG: NAD(P)H-dependent flavin oxidoreductase [Bacillota bacterium]